MISEWMFQWKMSFKLWFARASTHFISCITKTIFHPKVNFNNSPVVQSAYQKLLGLYLDENLNFSCHTKEKIFTAYTGTEKI